MTAGKLLSYARANALSIGLQIMTTIVAMNQK